MITKLLLILPFSLALLVGRYVVHLCCLAIGCRGIGNPVRPTTRVKGVMFAFEVINENGCPNIRIPEEDAINGKLFNKG